MTKNNTITLPRSVVEQALEALGQNEWGTAHHDFRVTTALRAALEQPQGELEPVYLVWRNFDLRGAWIEVDLREYEATQEEDRLMLYTNQKPPRQPLTDEQIARAVRSFYSSDQAAAMGLPDDICTARAIERAHGIVGEV